MKTANQNIKPITTKINEKGNSVVITKRLLLDEVQFINREIEKNSHKGFIFSTSKQRGLEFISKR